MHRGPELAFAQRLDELREEVAGEQCLDAVRVLEVDGRNLLRPFEYVVAALEVISDIELDAEITEASAEQARFLKTLRELDIYIRANAGFIPNYGERYRAGEVISSSLAESAVNQVISKRMVEKQQMRWSPRGAHLLLQVRTRALNHDLAGDFARWYPGFTQTPEATLDDQPVAA